MDKRRFQVLHPLEDERGCHQIEGLSQQPLDRPGHDGLPLSHLFPYAVARKPSSGVTLIFNRYTNDIVHLVDKLSRFLKSPFHPH
jgi:hypothetical protein